jgi:hypothetical protein
MLTLDDASLGLLRAEIEQALVPIEKKHSIRIRMGQTEAVKTDPVPKSGTEAVQIPLRITLSLS